MKAVALLSALLATVALASRSPSERRNGEVTIDDLSNELICDPLNSECPDYCYCQEWKVAGFKKTISTCVSDFGGYCDPCYFDYDTEADVSPSISATSTNSTGPAKARRTRAPLQG